LPDGPRHRGLGPIEDGVMTALTYPEALIVGAFQGVAELFPVSSLGHSVLVPALVGGRWARDLSVSATESPYLAFIVGLHVATAAALMAFFWRDWVRIVGGLLPSVRCRRMDTPDERLAWLLILATIPVGLTGLIAEHVFRTTLGKPIPAAVFLTVNGCVLFAAERLRRSAPVLAEARGVAAHGDHAAHRVHAAHGDHAVGHRGQVAEQGWVAERGAPATEPAGPATPGEESDRRLSRLSLGQGILIGAAQILALLPGISRSGATMAAGLLRGLSHEDA